MAMNSRGFTGTSIAVRAPMLTRIFSGLTVLAIVVVSGAQTACGGCYPIRAINVHASDPCLTAAPESESGTCGGVGGGKGVTVRVDNACGKDFIIASVRDSGVVTIGAGTTGSLDDTMATSPSSNHWVVSGTLGGVAATVSWDQDSYVK